MKNSRLYLVVITILLLSGCVKYNPAPLPIDIYLAEHNKKTNETIIAKFQKRLESEGVIFVTVGQDYMLVVPGDDLFYPSSPRIMWNSYGLLNDVGNYLRCFQKVNVKIVAYTKGNHSIVRDQLMSTARARNVSNYLWSQDIDARLMTIEGFSDDRTILGDCRDACKRISSLNSRIEISFRNELV